MHCCYRPAAETITVEAMTPTAADVTKSETARERPYDIIVFGATGFVGKLVVQHLAEHAPAELKVALAARHTSRLVKVGRAIPGRKWWRIVVDARDSDQVARLAQQAKVIITLVGPYWKYGRQLAHECAKAGTHYVDLTGEVLFTQESIRQNHELAQASGAKIVHSCGFDSIPSDVAVRALFDAASAPLGETTMLVQHLRGGVSGGTVDSLRAQVQAVADDPSLKRIVSDVYALSRPGADDGSFVADGAPRRFRGRLRAPFFMAPYNTRLVHRSAMFAGYGAGFRYRELMNVGSGLRSLLRAGVLTVGMRALTAAMNFTPTAKILTDKLPAPGEGPSQAERARGRFSIEAFTTDASGRKWRSAVSLEQDPGYEGTAMMISAAAQALLYDELPDTAGVLTPTVALGEALVERLRHGGMEISVREDSDVREDSN